MSTTAMTMEELESERAELLPSRETHVLLPPMVAAAQRHRRAGYAIHLHVGLQSDL